jgi:hypothetical protein
LYPAIFPDERTNISVSDLDQEIAAYETMRGELEAKHTGKWVIVHDRVLVAVYDSFEQAAAEAVKHFGSGPYLIRQVGAPPVALPASVMYNLTHG